MNKVTRGYRLNNPFNLDDNGIPWLGLIHPSSDPRFCEFETAVLGLRAGMVNLHTQLKEGYNTLTALITKYAPPCENDTASYIQAVSKETGLAPTDKLTPFNIIAISKAIIHHEQGSMVYDNPTLVQAAKLAGIIG